MYYDQPPMLARDPFLHGFLPISHFNDLGLGNSRRPQITRGTSNGAPSASMLPSTQKHPSPELLGIAREGVGLPNAQYFGFGRTFRLVDLQSPKADTIQSAASTAAPQSRLAD
ncbi:hypothetical protein NUW54_g9729 [Trametes sanguinea]|uniref:Uncharacterized protein n=1 Tax=Trametes sanguinea TaxID=158606 RepID=A0ACC1P6X5_9APHY|nr:hypothetical protein NUW54_g9729 [Trametes sanguinea]